MFKDDAEIVATIVAGDNYFNEEHETSVRTVVDTLARYRPDLVIAGPAFNAGRYGLSCAEVCHLALADGIPAVTAMFEENPGTLTYKKRGRHSADQRGRWRDAGCRRRLSPVSV